MKHKNYQEEVNKFFEETGYMSNSYLMRKYKINMRKAHLMMKPLEKDCWLVKKQNGIILRLVRDCMV